MEQWFGLCPAGAQPATSSFQARTSREPSRPSRLLASGVVAQRPYSASLLVGPFIDTTPCLPLGQVRNRVRRFRGPFQPHRERVRCSALGLVGRSAVLVAAAPIDDAGYRLAHCQLAHFRRYLRDRVRAKRRRGDMRGYSNVRIRPDRIAREDRLAFKHIERGASDVPVFYRREQCANIEMPSSSDVDHVTIGP